jgi:hypothetical protein
MTGKNRQLLVTVFRYGFMIVLAISLPSRLCLWWFHP